jgi:predicted dehydrogenase
MLARFPVIDDRPTPPRTRAYGIALIGCGGIVNYAHLPAYAQHGLKVVGCYDLNRDAALSTATAHGIPRVYESVDELLIDPDVTIVDIAVHPAAQPDLAVRCIEAGKHILCQKPIALNPIEARRIVDSAALMAAKAAVNQQMRWSGGIAAAKQIIERGFIGELTDLQINVSVKTPWHMWPWLRDSDQLDVMFHSIHYIDAIRFLAGDPELVTSRHTTFPGQPERAETKTVTVLDYATRCQALIAVNHHDESGGVHAWFRVLGTEGVIEGDIGLLATYPEGGVDTVRARRGDEPEGEWHEPILKTLWMPDAFIGPMASLINAIDTGGTPLTNVADNLNTVRVVTAAYESMSQGRTMPLNTIPG